VCTQTDFRRSNDLLTPRSIIFFYHLVFCGITNFQCACDQVISTSYLHHITRLGASKTLNIYFMRFKKTNKVCATCTVDVSKFLTSSPCITVWNYLDPIQWFQLMSTCAHLHKILTSDGNRKRLHALVVKNMYRTMFNLWTLPSMDNAKYLVNGVLRCGGAFVGPVVIQALSGCDTRMPAFIAVVVYKHRILDDKQCVSLVGIATSRQVHSTRDSTMPRTPMVSRFHNEDRGENLLLIYDYNTVGEDRTGYDLPHTTVGYADTRSVLLKEGVWPGDVRAIQKSMPKSNPPMVKRNPKASTGVRRCSLM
jgi:hypothetical protein